MTTTSPFPETPVLTESSIQVDGNAQDPRSLVQHFFGDNVITNNDDVANDDVDWTTLQQMCDTITDSEDQPLSSPHDSTLEDEHAQAALRDTAPSTSTPVENEASGTDKVEPTQEFTDGEFELPKRELRSQWGEKRTFPTTWIDNDETGIMTPRRRSDRKDRNGPN
ncbi:hypothetical protein CLAFUW4_01474 [Fulvia fulva]|uniref:Uncharacterized protein n=1 Tax=Passalora fulva TaxID=5499 RepID=A0A9Q8P3Q1_PASFU|nr:uncharacterized protein CLAFUR5_01476 [Fulvia fulva]KAK4636141.1 hypothetical protein CLAFUR4_01475 [Fulvia fulva]KAK4637323.1 hypothetical protein CLAFUR0_01476 [Fulvia fulva]UJO12044.1 hypothetical protein CLAFUR5_01476 [Fulvia fulva]WPV08185.1 hypothetical protein CLAFUW4_01474 [Fulvia fulva]WPV25154.1 hypothetical protein CLAFUW7_01479 [Fulvia fulva]